MGGVREGMGVAEIKALVANVVRRFQEDFDTTTDTADTKNPPCCPCCRCDSTCTACSKERHRTTSTLSTAITHSLTGKRRRDHDPYTTPVLSLQRSQGGLSHLHPHPTQRSHWMKYDTAEPMNIQHKKVRKERKMQGLAANPHPPASLVEVPGEVASFGAKGEALLGVSVASFEEFRACKLRPAHIARGSLGGIAVKPKPPEATTANPRIALGMLADISSQTLHTQYEQLRSRNISHEDSIKQVCRGRGFAIPDRVTESRCASALQTIQNASTTTDRSIRLPPEFEVNWQLPPPTVQILETACADYWRVAVLSSEERALCTTLNALEEDSIHEARRKQWGGDETAKKGAREKPADSEAEQRKKRQNRRISRSVSLLACSLSEQVNHLPAPSDDVAYAIPTEEPTNRHEVMIHKASGWNSKKGVE